MQAFTRTVAVSAALSAGILFGAGPAGAHARTERDRPNRPKAPGAGKPCHALITPGRMRWVTEDAFPGLRFAYLQGDPSKPGPYTMRVRIPGGQVMPPHYHPHDEVGTVMSGTFYTGAGPTVDKKHSQALPAGSVGIIPRGCVHFAWTRVTTVVQVHGSGPWEMQLVDAQGKPHGDPLRLAGPRP